MIQKYAIFISDWYIFLCRAFSIAFCINLITVCNKNVQQCFEYFEALENIMFIVRLIYLIFLQKRSKRIFAEKLDI